MTNEKLEYSKKIQAKIEKYKTYLGDIINAEKSNMNIALVRFDSCDGNRSIYLRDEEILKDSGMSSFGLTTLKTYCENKLVVLNEIFRNL